MRRSHLLPFQSGFWDEPLPLTLPSSSATLSSASRLADALVVCYLDCLLKPDLSQSSLFPLLLPLTVSPSPQSISLLLTLLALLLSPAFLLSSVWAPPLTPLPALLSPSACHPLPASANGSAPPVVQLRVLSFNVQQGFGRSGATNADAVRRILAEQRPDIVM